jgi:hypothetical protein
LFRALEIEGDERTSGSEDVPPVFDADEISRQDALVDHAIDVAHGYARHHGGFRCRQQFRRAVHGLCH